MGLIKRWNLRNKEWEIWTVELLWIFMLSFISNSRKNVSNKCIETSLIDFLIRIPNWYFKIIILLFIGKSFYVIQFWMVIHANREWMFTLNYCLWCRYSQRFYNLKIQQIFTIRDELTCKTCLMLIGSYFRLLRHVKFNT